MPSMEARKLVNSFFTEYQGQQVTLGDLISFMYKNTRSLPNRADVFQESLNMISKGKDGVVGTDDDVISSMTLIKLLKFTESNICEDVFVALDIVHDGMRVAKRVKQVVGKCC